MRIGRRVRDVWARSSAESINDLDGVIGTWGIGSRLPPSSLFLLRQKSVVDYGICIYR